MEEMKMQMDNTASETLKDRPEVKVTNKDIRKVFFRSLFEMCTINYERFQSLGYLYSIAPLLRKFYPDKERRAEACKRHMEMFNTHNSLINPIMGTSIAIEEKIANMPEGADTKDLEASVNNIKVGLMGPFAGLGDSIIGATIIPILGAIGAGMALDGSIAGPLFFLIVYNAIDKGFRYYSTFYGYRKGVSILKDIKTSNIIQKISEGSSVLGLMVLGCLVSSWVDFKITKVLNFQGMSPIDIQKLLDGIIPGLLPLGLTLLLVFFFRKKWTSGKLVFVIFALALVFTLTGLCG